MKHGPNDVKTEVSNVAEIRDVKNHETAFSVGWTTQPNI